MATPAMEAPPVGMAEVAPGPTTTVELTVTTGLLVAVLLEPDPGVETGVEALLELGVLEGEGVGVMLAGAEVVEAAEDEEDEGADEVEVEDFEALLLVTLGV
jgi:hypothetical protein